MFKAIDQQAGIEVVILAPGWAERLEELRTLDHEDRLICQGCKEPVRVKAGAVRTWHFAHKHLQDCHYGHESPELLAARAALYARLQRQFGEAATIEKRLDDPRFPRPVDCWVETGDAILAYWILDSQMRPEAREALRQAFAEATVRVQWVFTSGVLRADAEEDALVHLRTTERELMQKAWVDCDLRGNRLEEGESLTYLDGTEGTLTAYRGLRCVHEPQVYRGRREAGPLAEVRVAPSTGELAHPRELERARRLRREQRERERAEQERLAQEAREERERQERWEREQQERLARELWERQQREEEMRREQEQYEEVERLRQEKIRSARLQWEQAQGRPPEQPASRRAPDAPEVVAVPGSILRLTAQEGICVFCGRRTTDWWKIDHATKQCKCRDCLRQGRH